MTVRCSLSVVALAMLAAAPPARADNGAVRKALQGDYNRISKAFQQRDAAAYSALLAPDATITTPSHETWDRARMVKDFATQSAMMHGATWKRTVTAVQVRGNKATATVTGRFHGAFKGRDGKQHVFDLEALTVDTWERSGGAWKLEHADTRKLNPKIDGKAPPPGMAGHR